MKTNLGKIYFLRRLSAYIVALALAFVCGYLINSEQFVWAVCGAFLVMPTTPGTPVRQGLVILIISLLAVVIGFITGYFFLEVTWTRELLQLLQDRLLLIIIGSLITIACKAIIFPVMQYQEFQRSLIVMLDALIRYSTDLQGVILRGGKIEIALLDIAYPEWVFETGFNRNFRGSFRYVLIQLDRIIEALFSIDFYIHQTIDTDLQSDVSKQLAAVIAKNTDLLRIIRQFFADEKNTSLNENYITDMTDLHNILQTALPDSLELLDVSPDYTTVTSIVRDVTDMRELLLQILTGLPVDDVAANPS